MGSTCAFADNSASITIKDNNPEGTATTEFVYYELLKASIATDGSNAVSYYLPSPAGDTLKGLLDAVAIDGADLFTFTKSSDGTRWNVTVNEKDTTNHTKFTDADGPAIAAALNTTDIKAAALSTNANVTPNTFKMNNGSASATGLDEGYYLITSSLGTALVLQTIGTVEINTKNEYITNVKTASKTNMNVGDTVTYTITVHVPATALVDEYITVHDILDEHLAFKDGTLAAHLDTATGTVVDLDDGTPKQGATETFTKKFKITSDMIDKDVLLIYDAELLSTAADDTGYVNTTFANDDSYETVPSKVRVWTFDFDLDKNFTGATGDGTGLVATFKLVKGDKTYSFVKDGNKYTVADSDDQNTVNVITVNGKDNVNICGLEAGVYTLTELTTADGYNLLTDAITVTITDTSDSDTATNESKTPSHTVSYKVGENGSEKTGTVTVENNKGAVLPSTGGSGTTMIYIIGVILLAGAGILLVTRRRMKAE